jgi:hypothetical protein
LKFFLEWTPKVFCEKIGGGCFEHADKFESLKEIFSSNSVKLNKLTIGSIEGEKRSS